MLLILVDHWLKALRFDFLAQNLFSLGWNKVGIAGQNLTISTSIPASRKEALGDDVLQLFSVDKNFILTILYHRIKFYNIEKERLVLQRRKSCEKERVRLKW